jgi:hypothetical protein
MLMPPSCRRSVSDRRWIQARQASIARHNTRTRRLPVTCDCHTEGR